MLDQVFVEIEARRTALTETSSKLNATDMSYAELKKSTSCNELRQPSQLSLSDEVPYFAMRQHETCDLDNMLPSMLGPAPRMQSYLDAAELLRL